MVGYIFSAKRDGAQSLSPGAFCKRAVSYLAMLGAVLSLQSVLAMYAHADCSFQSGGFYRYTVTGPVSVGVRRDAISTTILQTNMVSGSGPAVVSCSGNNGAGPYNARGTQPSSGVTMPLDIPALSWIFYYSSWSGTGYGVWPIGNTHNNGAFNPGAYPAGVKITLAGTLSAPYTVKAGRLGYFRSGSLNISEIWLANDITIYPLQCTMTTPKLDIDLGTYMKSTFTGNGYTTPTRDVNLIINACSAGMNIQYSVDPATSIVSSANSVVKLDATSGATGIGVQILKSDGTTVQPLQTRTTLTTNSTASGSYTIPLKARYYQTSPTVTTGNANSSITVTMYYQ